MKLFAATLLLAATSHAIAFDPDALTKSNRELAARNAEKPAWKVKEEAETAEIKMRSFDQSTVGRTAFIFATQVDDETPRSAMVAILYRDLPCQLPLSAARDMHAGESLYGRSLVPACWGRVVTPTKDEVIIVTKFGDARRESLISYAEVKIQPGGSGRFIKPAFPRNEFMKNVDDFHKSIR
ncbi:hypothetical protein ACTMU2_29350 [Cupriavidus basilensis]